MVKFYAVEFIRNFGRIAYNGMQACTVRLSELPVSKPTNVYIEDNCFLASRKITALATTCLRASDDPRSPHWANLLLVVGRCP